MKGISKSLTVLIYAGICLLFIPSLEISASLQTTEKASQIGLEEILRRARHYCRMLDYAVLDFICLEEIEEKIAIFRETLPGYLGTKQYRTTRKNKYVYDYQFVRKGDSLKESRILLEENGRRTNQKNVELQTEVFRYENLLYGPIWLLSRLNTDYYNYLLVGEEKREDVITAIVEVIPKPEHEQTYMPFGKVWIDLKDFSVLRIAYSPQTVQNLESIHEIAKRYDAKPDISQVTDFGFKKNGLRFPSQHMIIEAYVNQSGKKFIRSETTVIFKDYKFFTVETEVKYKK